MQLFHPLDLLAEAYASLGKHSDRAATLKECLECMDGPVYYAFAPQLCYSIMLCLESAGESAHSKTYKLKAMEAARIRAGISAELFEKIKSKSDRDLP